MFICNVYHNGKRYKVSVSKSEKVIGVVSLDKEEDENTTGIVFNSDGKTPCSDLHVKKRILRLAKDHVARKEESISEMLKR